MRSDAHVITDLTILHDKVVGQRIYDENKHKPIRRMLPSDYSAPKCAAPERIDRRKKAKSASVIAGREHRLTTAANTERCLDYLRTNGPATSETLATVLGLNKRVVAVSMGQSKITSWTDTPLTQADASGHRRRLRLWAIRKAA